MNKNTIARALGMLTDVRQTMDNVNRSLPAPMRAAVLCHEPWINTLDHALGLIKNELTVEEAYTYAQRNA